MPHLLCNSLLIELVDWCVAYRTLRSKEHLDEYSCIVKKVRIVAAADGAHRIVTTNVGGKRLERRVLLQLRLT